MLRSRLFRRAFLVISVLVVLHTVALWMLTVPFIRTKTIEQETDAAQLMLDFTYDFVRTEYESQLKAGNTGNAAATLVLNLRSVLHDKRIARSGYFFVFNGSGTMLIHPNTKLEGTDVRAILDPVSGKPVFGEFVAAVHLPRRRLEYLWDRPGDFGNYTHKKIAWVRHFKPLDWYIVGSAYTADLQIPADAMLTRIIGASVIILIAYLLILALFIRAHLRPIRDLAIAAHRVAGGDLTVHCDVGRRDELAVLARAFNDMVDQVRANIHQLDVKVNARTEELAGANRELRASVARMREIQDRLMESERLAREASKAKSAFVAAMSHEFRTPLNAIIGYSEMLEEECEDAGLDELIPDTTKIQMAGRQLLELVDDVLDLSRIEAGRMDFFIEEFPVADVVADCRATIQPQADRNNNALIVHCPPEVGTMASDRVRVRQVLINLLSNACKFTESGTVKLTAERVGAGDEWIEFRITDTGVGMTQEQVERLFRAFTQGDAAVERRFGGTGLGLNLSRRICRDLGGDITVVSHSGEGSTFTARLPAVAAPKGKDVAHASTEGTPPAAGQAEPIVLVVEDDDGVRNVIRRFLLREGVLVLTARDGEECLTLARKVRPSAITLDVVMPRMNGWTTLRELRADPALANIPVVLLTVEDNRDRGFALGASDYLVKPIDPRRLVQVLTKYLPPAPSHTILVIERRDDERSVFREILTRAKWRVSEARDRDEALASLDAGAPEIVLLDLPSFGTGAIGLLNELKRDDRLRDVPVLVQIAGGLSPEERDVLDAAADAVFDKSSFSREDLLDALRRLLRERAAQPEDRP